MSEGMQGGTVRCDWEGAVARVTVSNPSKANAIDAGMLDQLEDIAERLKKRVRAVIIRGDGAKHFCSGADIDSWAPMTPEEFAVDWVSKGILVFNDISNLPSLVIAAVNGTCFGGGLELALHADVRYAAKGARFGFPETGIGAVPGWMGVTLAKLAVGHGLAAEMILGGRVLSAEEALEAGLVSKVLEPGQLDAAADELASAACKRSKVANRVAKRLLFEDNGLLGCYEYAAKECKASADGAEGIAAFRERREADYSSKVKNRGRLFDRSGYLELDHPPEKKGKTT